jgi:hypothetical protein
MGTFFSDELIRELPIFAKHEVPQLSNAACQSATVRIFNRFLGFAAWWLWIWQEIASILQNRLAQSSRKKSKARSKRIRAWINKSNPAMIQHDQLDPAQLSRQHFQEVLVDLETLYLSQCWISIEVLCSICTRSSKLLNPSSSKKLLLHTFKLSRQRKLSEGNPPCFLNDAIVVQVLD